MPWWRTEGSSSPQNQRWLRDFPEWLGFGLVALFVASVLAMAATWFLVGYYPTPVDDVISFGFLGFLFVVLLDFFLIYHFARSKVRQGQRLAAVKWSVGLILLGLLAATLVGSLPWLWRRLVTALPWVSDIPWEPLLLLLVVAVSLWSRWHSWHTRKASR